MDVLRICRLVTWAVMGLVLIMHIVVFFYWPDRPFVPPDTWQAIGFLKKHNFLGLQPGERARVLFEGELIELEGMAISYDSGKPTMKKAIRVSFQKAYLNDPLKHVDVVFGVLDDVPEEGRFPMLLMNTQIEGQL